MSKEIEIFGAGEVAGKDSDVPAIVSDAGAAAKYAYEEFFFGTISNEHTRRAYRTAVHGLLGWCDDKQLGEISPRDIRKYLNAHNWAPATKKRHLSAIRHFFDILVSRHAMILNPAASVRGERLQVIEGKTPDITPEQARTLLTSIDTSHVVGLRDRAVIGIMIYTAARVGAVAKLKCKNFYHTGQQYCLRFDEKAGKSREIPVRHDLECYILEYLQAAGMNVENTTSPLFRTAVGKTKTLTRNGMCDVDMGRMVKRRIKDVGLPMQLSPHSFRAGTATDLLEQGVPSDDVQYLLGHADPRTTRLYDRRKRRVTRNIVERISV